jgi:hypothetical protein
MYFSPFGFFFPYFTFIFTLFSVFFVVKNTDFWVENTKKKKLELKNLYDKKNPAQFQLENGSAQLGLTRLGNFSARLESLREISLVLITTK